MAPGSYLKRSQTGVQEATSPSCLIGPVYIVLETELGEKDTALLSWDNRTVECSACALVVKASEPSRLQIKMVREGLGEALGPWRSGGYCAKWAETQVAKFWGHCRQCWGAGVRGNWSLH